jgi:VanZ family protein
MTVVPLAAELDASPEPQIRLYMPPARPDRLRRRIARRAAAWAGLLLAGYWTTAFAATHLPMPHEGNGNFLNVPHADKFVHFGMYCGLALLLSVWFGVRRRIGRAVLVAGIVLCVLSGYAAFDEISQAPVGRDPDLHDWFADLAGVNVGLCGFFALRRWVRR